jgi:hypothetical protein
MYAQSIQWPHEKRRKDNNWFTKHCIENWKTKGKLIWLEWVSNSCSTSATHRVTVKWHKHNLVWKSSWTPVCLNTYKRHQNMRFLKYEMRGLKISKKVIRSRDSKKDKHIDKKPSNGRRATTQKTKAWTTRTRLKQGWM